MHSFYLCDFIIPSLKLCFLKRIALIWIDSLKPNQRFDSSISPRCILIKSHKCLISPGWPRHWAAFSETGKNDRRIFYHFVLVPPSKYVKTRGFRGTSVPQFLACLLVKEQYKRILLLGVRIRVTHWIVDCHMDSLVFMLESQIMIWGGQTGTKCMLKIWNKPALAEHE